MTRKEQIGIIRAALRDSIALGTNLHQEIHALTWVGGRPPELPVSRNEEGHRLTGKKAFKAYKRPETGPQRYELWGQKRYAGTDSRWLFLALGFLRGRPYKSIESKTYTPASGYFIHSKLKTLLKEVDVPRGDIDRWLAGESIQKAA